MVLRDGIWGFALFPLLWWPRCFYILLLIFNSTNKNKKQEQKKNGDKGGKALYKLMNNTVFDKAMKNLRNGIGVKLVNSKKRLFKMYTKIHPSYMSHK